MLLGSLATSLKTLLQSNMPLQGMNFPGFMQGEDGGLPQAGSKPGGYVPPSKRGGAGGEGDSMRRREENSVRVTNLSEDTREDDLRVSPSRDLLLIILAAVLYHLRSRLFASKLTGVSHPLSTV